MEIKDLRECFGTALKDEQRGRKHKGLVVMKSDQKKAEEYIGKAKKELNWCEPFKNDGDSDYKIPEQWFYTLYYCGLAILAKFGIESRSQRCTALFLKYLREKELISYGSEFIDKIMVYKEKVKESEVDKREEARYGSWIKNEEVRGRYDEMMNICKKAISECEEVVYSREQFKIPEELL